MKKISGLGLAGFLLLNSLRVLAQSYSDEALMFSRLSTNGSARIQGLGGAQVALGGDYSSAFSNPAGLGFYNKSEATLSMGLNFNSVSSLYLDNTTKDSRANFNIPGFSIVLHSDKSNGKLVSGNFAISLTRTNNFNQNFKYSGINLDNSLIDSFIEQSSWNPSSPYNKSDYFPSQFQEGGPAYYTLSRLAFNNALIGPLSERKIGGDSSQYHTYITQIPLQQESVKISGAQNQVNFAYGLNFNDSFYLGAAIGLPSMNYHALRTYSEQFPPGSPIYGFTLADDYTIKGAGINLTLGTIIRPKDFIQFGASIATPTYYYSLSDNYSATLTSNWNSYTYTDSTYSSNSRYLTGGYKDSMDQLITDYTLTTPWRIKAGATIFIKKHGFITGEVESINYGKARLVSQTDGVDFSSDNNTIKTYFGNVLNIRAGGEYRFNKYRVRLGYSYMPDPYKSVQDNVENSITNFSCGAGYRTDKYFFDVSTSLTKWNAPYEPYYVANHGPSPVVKLQNNTTSIVFTFGFTL